jgi:hypothetical protein
MSKWKVYDEEIKNALSKNENITDIEIVKLLCKDLERLDRKDFSRYIRRNKKRFNDDYEGSYTATETLDIDNTTVKHMWIKNKEASLFVKNPNFISHDIKEEKINEIDFLSIFKDKITPIIPTYKRKEQDYSKFDRLVISDIHVGMDVNPDGYALYGGVWDEDALNDRLKKVIDYVVAHQKSKVLVIHDLGDLMDGWDGFTTRGGHKLPQNMTNQKAFDVALRFKIRLIDSLILFYDEIIIVDICDDNHGGAFTYVVNSAFKTYIELKYSNIKVTNQRKFIDHYIVGKLCFILTHGKDSKSLKFGFKPILDAKQIEKIKNYIDENNLHSYKIEFSKGDSHQLMFDSSTSKHFEYQNFGAFSPPSNWVQTNFQNSISSFTFFNYFETQKSQHNYIF